MGRTATNVIGNSLATAVVAKYEPAEDEAGQEVAEPAVQPNVG
jgi:Na+/H+-dicarboxylate symporter